MADSMGLHSFSFVVKPGWVGGSRMFSTTHTTDFTNVLDFVGLGYKHFGEFMIGLTSQQHIRKLIAPFIDDHRRALQAGTDLPLPAAVAKAMNESQSLLPDDNCEDRDAPPSNSFDEAEISHKLATCNYGARRDADHAQVNRQILALINQVAVFPRRQVPDRPWKRYFENNCLRVILPAGITWEQFEGPVRSRRSVETTKRLLQSLRNNEIVIEREQKPHPGTTVDSTQQNGPYQEQALQGSTTDSHQPESSCSDRFTTSPVTLGSDVSDLFDDGRFDMEVSPD